MGIEKSRILTGGLSDSASDVTAKQIESSIESGYDCLAKIYTEGFDDSGELIHNMPCPICISDHAKYQEVGGKLVFGPCDKCSKDGFKIVKKGRWL